MIKVANGYVEIGDRVYSNKEFLEQKDSKKILCEEDDQLFSVIVNGIDYEKGLLRYSFECYNDDSIKEIRPDEEQYAINFYIKRETQIKNLKKSINSLLNNKDIIFSKDIINNILFHLKS